MFFQQLFNGITVGSVYVLIAIGLTMIYGVLELLHFAHGVVYMAGAFAAVSCITLFHSSIFIAVIAAMIVSAFFGWLIEFFAYKPVRNSPKITALISGIGMAIVLENVYRIIYGSQTRAFPQEGIAPIKTYNISQWVSITNYQIYIMVVAAVLVIILHLYLKKTKSGMAMRAVSMDFDASSLMGISVNKVISVTFIIGSALAGVAGTLVALYFNAVYPSMGSMPGMKAFAIVVLGGLGSIPGTIIGGLFLGIVESFADGYLGNFIVGKDAFAFIILILVLLIKPSGIFGKKIEKV
ncbi:branched-chain amino acid ABC transporter permease [Clostridium sp. A1-XYC3]|uniref:Branched-chain amino acid ABC transporter permease n=1 Tax=Clostridium tanneri TaxID=3037988 RepID=A0ABU4JVR5_9CLOT|nr:branched-chain amino acid ABC transporter permease [Clostridium sp. A1-XYC3]MDW8802019.1 branched-chain amino acid ABC transporter permease [Clostridium sp. A1-XYC3]